MLFLRPVPRWSVAVALAAAGAGCGSRTVSPPDSSEKGVLDRDAAETVASDVARESGGVIDEVADLLEMATGAAFDDPLRTQGPGHLWASLRSATYDEELGRWRLSLEREHGAPGDDVYAHGEREIEVTFLTAGETPQKYFDTDGVLADRIRLVVSNGTGEHRCPGRTHGLSEVTGMLLATDVATPVITVNGTLHRRGVSTIVTADASLTVTRALDVTLTDVTGRRGADPFVAQNVSGTLTGTLRADIVSTEGVAPRVVDRTVDVSLDEGDAVISSGGAEFTGDLQIGEIRSDVP